MDGRLKSVEQMQLNSVTPTSSSDSSTSRTKRKVPAKVVMTVRDVYKALLDEDENFTGYDTNKRFIEKHNQDVVSRLVSEAGKLDTNVPVIQLRDAARRFYQTNIETTALKDKGKYDAKVTQQRRRNRLKRKLDSRQSVILKSSVTDAQRDALKKVLVREFMSSEESGEEVVDGEKRSVLLVKPLPWRASKLDRIFKQVNHKANKNKTKQSKQQTLPRVIGSRSTRVKPVGFGDDFWGFANS